MHIEDIFRSETLVNTARERLEFLRVSSLLQQSLLLLHVRFTMKKCVSVLATAKHQALLKRVNDVNIP